MNKPTIWGDAGGSLQSLAEWTIKKRPDPVSFADFARRRPVDIPLAVKLNRSNTIFQAYYFAGKPYTCSV